MNVMDNISSSTNLNSIFNPDVVEKYFLDDNHEEALKIFSSYSHKMLECIDSRLSQLNEAYLRMDKVSIRFTVHIIKGSCSALGAPQIVRLCENIESSINQDSEEELGQKVHELIRLNGLFKDELKNYVDEIDAKYHFSIENNK